MTTATETPQVYVACLGCYNAGKLNGAWLELTSGLWGDVNEAMGADPETGHLACSGPDSPHEELMVHDWDWPWEHGCPGEVGVSEAESLAVALEALDSDTAGLAMALVSLGVCDLEDAREYLEDAYQGEWRALEDWAESFLEDTGGLEGMPENLRCYFDFAAFARDCELGGDVFTVEDGGMIHVFWN